MTDQIKNIPRHIALKIKAGWVSGLFVLFFKGFYLFAAAIASSENNNLYFLFHVIDFTVFAIIIFLIFLKVWMAAITAAVYIIYTVINFFYLIEAVYIPFADIIVTLLLLLQSAWGIVQYKMLLNNPDKERIIKEATEKEKYQETQYEEIDDLEDDYWMTEKQKSKKKSD